jgi:type IX secretion system PorP/SprF family membrane protein
MKKLYLLIFLVILQQTEAVNAQEADYGPGYQTIVMTNPAFSGSEGDGILRLSYFNFYPGMSYDLNSFFASYDSFFPLLHGGAGFWISNDYTGGIINDIRGGFTYSYHLQAGDMVFINAALGASLFYRGYRMSGIILPDQIDPLRGAVLPTGEALDLTGHAAFDVGAGFLIMAGRYSAGFAVSHLTEPDISGSGLPADKMKRKITVNLDGTFFNSGKSKIALRPLLYGMIQGNNSQLGAGADFKTGFFSLSSMLLINNAKDLDLETGISFIHRSFFVFYNYCINLVSGNSLLPSSLYQHAGLGISLNYVDKRKTIKTINFPKL